MGNNDYRGIAKKTGQTRSMRCIIAADQEERREGYGCYDRKQIANTERSSRHSESITKDGQALYYLRSIGGDFSRGSLQSEARGFRPLPCRGHSTARRRQKIKPACGWPVTTKKITAVSLPLIEPEKLTRDKPWYRLLIFIIHSCQTKINCVLRAWACEI